MTPSEIVAYIGAAAWLPQIFSWTYRILSRPKLKLISAPTLELGYTTYGPIVNLTCSISAARKDALIDNIAIELIHERGDTRYLTWSFLDEKQQQIRSYKGETAEITKNQQAIALKVPTIALAEKKIGFQDLEFQDNFRMHANKLAEIETFVKKNEKKGKKKSANQVFGTKEFNDFTDFFTNQMYWKEGKYTLRVLVKEVTIKKPHIESFQIALSKANIDRLIENCSKLESELRAYIGVAKKKDADTRWNWVYPLVKPVG